MKIEGIVIAHLFDGNVLCPGFPVTITNLITSIGDQMVQKKVSGAGTVSTTIAGMKLGSSTVTTTKTGIAAYIGTTCYIASSAITFATGFPTIGTTLNTMEMKSNWATGLVTGTVAEIAIVNNNTDAGEADETGTFARALFPAPFVMTTVNKLDTTWIWTFIGS